MYNPKDVTHVATEKSKIKEFFEAGKKSFLGEGSRIPAQNKDFTELSKANPSNGNTKKYLEQIQAFVDGWDFENLRAPVPEWSKEENDVLYNLDCPYFKKYEDL